MKTDISIDSFLGSDEDGILIIEKTDNYVEYFIEDIDRSRIFYYPDKINREHMQNILLVDDLVRHNINVDVIIDFILKEINMDSLSFCRNIVLIWSDDCTDRVSESLIDLSRLYNDDHALEIMDDMFGITWVERQIIILDIGRLKRACVDNIHFLFNIISTLFHEFRHLVYECNDLVVFGFDEYPLDGGDELEVEKYGNWKAFQVYNNYRHLLR